LTNLPKSNPHFFLKVTNYWVECGRSPFFLVSRVQTHTKIGRLRHFLNLIKISQLSRKSDSSDLVLHRLTRHVQIVWAVDGASWFSVNFRELTPRISLWIRVLSHFPGLVYQISRKISQSSWSRFRTYV